MPFAWAEPVADNDDHTVSAVLGTHADRITFTILGDDGLERDHGKTFGPHEVERADLYAHEVTVDLNLPLTFYFAPEVRGDA
jgi:hypothetical protein